MVRYEAQTRIHDHRRGAARGSRLGLAPKGQTPKAVIRAGAGLFYDRVSESLSLDALRRDGVHQQQFIVEAPDFYPVVPSIDQLLSNRAPQAIRERNAAIRAPYMAQVGIGAERQLPKGLVVAVHYLHSQGWHSLRSRALAPAGNAGAVYLYESSGIFRQHQLVTTLTAPVNARISFNGSYTLGKANATRTGRNVSRVFVRPHPECGRAAFDVRHRVQFSGSFALGWGLRLSPMLTALSTGPSTSR